MYGADVRDGRCTWFAERGIEAMEPLKQRLLLFLRSDDGPTATEYAVLLAVIAVVTLASMSAFGERMNNIYLAIEGTLDVF